MFGPSKVLILVLGIWHACHAEEPNLVTVTSGIISAKLEGFKLYDGTIPLYFNVPLPKLIKPSPPAQDCLASKYLCNLANSTYQSVKLFEEEYKEYPMYSSIESSMQPRGVFNFIGELHKMLYGTATQSDLLRFEKQILSIEKNEELLAKRILSDDHFAANFQQNFTLYTTQLHRYLEEEKAAFEGEIQKNARTNLRNEGELAYIANTLNVAIYYLHSLNAFTAAATSCREGKFPLPMVHDKFLSRQIDLLKKNIANSNYEVVGTNNQLIQKATSSCVFTKEVLQIKIDVPVKKIDSNYEMFRATPIPFKHFHEVCYISKSTDYFIKNEKVVIPLNHLDYGCDVHSLFCQIPKFPTKYKDFASCLHHHHRNLTSDISSSCVLQCSESSSKFLADVGDHQLVLTNYKHVRYDCPGAVRQMQLQNELGSNLIYIPCACNVSLDGQVVDHDFQCGNSGVEKTTQYSTAIPAAWSLHRSLLINMDSSSFGNITDVMNYNWKGTVPYFNFSARVVEPLKLRKLQATLPIYGDWDLDEKYLIYWMSTLTLITIFMLCMMCFPHTFGRGIGAYIPFLPGVAAADTDEAGIFKKIINKLTSVQWEEAGLALLMIFFILVLIILVLRLLKIAKKSARFMEENL